MAAYRQNGVTVSFVCFSTQAHTTPSLTQKHATEANADIETEMNRVVDRI